MKATASLLSFLLLSFFLPMCSNAQNGNCWRLQSVAAQCDSCTIQDEPPYTKNICESGQQSGGKTCSVAAYSYPCAEPSGEGAGQCYGQIFMAETFGTCGGASPATSRQLGKKAQLALNRLIIWIPNSAGGYQEASLSVPDEPSQKVRLASDPPTIFIPNSDGGYQDASFAATSCPSAKAPRR